MSLPVKNWLSPIASHQKVLAAMLAYGLSRKLNRHNYEVVHESHIDLTAIDSEVADVVVYDIKNNFHTELVIELCDPNNQDSTLRTLEIMTKIYNLRETFAYNTVSAAWYRVTQTEVFKSAISPLYNLNMEDLLSESLYGKF